MNITNPFPDFLGGSFLLQFIAFFLTGLAFLFSPLNPYPRS